MKIRDLLEVLWTDSVVLVKGTEILVDCETPYIKEALAIYLNEDVAKIVPLNNVIEITIK